MTRSFLPARKKLRPFRGSKNAFLLSPLLSVRVRILKNEAALRLLARIDALYRERIRAIMREEPAVTAAVQIDQRALLAADLCKLCRYRRQIEGMQKHILQLLTTILQVLPESPSPLPHPPTTPPRKNRPSVRRFLSLPSKCVRRVLRVRRRSRSTPPAA